MLESRPAGRLSFSCGPLWWCILRSPRGPPARRGHRFLFRKKAVGKSGPGEVSPGTPSKYAQRAGLKSLQLQKCGGPKAMAVAYEVPGEPDGVLICSLPTAVEVGGFRKCQTKTFRQRQKAFPDTEGESS